MMEIPPGHFMYNDAENSPEESMLKFWKNEIISEEKLITNRKDSVTKIRRLIEASTEKVEMLKGKVSEMSKTNPEFEL